MQGSETKRFLLRGVLFIAILAVLLIIINLLYVSFVLQHTKLYRSDQSYQEFIGESKHIKYAFFGASLTLNDVNPRHINNSINLGGAGEYYLHTYYRVRRVLEKDDVKVDTAFVEIVPHTFSNALVDDQRILANTNYYSKLLSYQEMQEATGASRVELVAKKTFPFIGKGSDAIDFLRLDSRTDLYLGWENNTDLYNWTPAEAQKAAGLIYRRDFGDGSGGINNESLYYFSETLRLLHKHNVSIVLIRYPARKEYNEVIAQNGTVDAYYERIFAAVDVPYRYLDYHDVFEDHPEYFADSYHLNYLGSEAFMKLLNEDLEERYEFQTE